MTGLCVGAGAENAGMALTGRLRRSEGHAGPDRGWSFTGPSGINHRGPQVRGGASASPCPRRVRCPVARTVGRTVAGNGICQRYSRQRWFCPDNAGLRSMPGCATACPRRRRGGLTGLRTLPNLQAPQGALWRSCAPSGIPDRSRGLAGFEARNPPKSSEKMGEALLVLIVL